jgi:hypothetical protein
LGAGGTGGMGAWAIVNWPTIKQKAPIDIAL